MICIRLAKKNGVAFMFIGKLDNTFLPVQFWPCLYFASLSAPSGLALSPDFGSCEPKLRVFYCCDMNWCDDVGKEIRFEWIGSAVTTILILLEANKRTVDDRSPEF